MVLDIRSIFVLFICLSFCNSALAEQEDYVIKFSTPIGLYVSEAVISESNKTVAFRANNSIYVMDVKSKKNKYKIPGSSIAGGKFKPLAVNDVGIVVGVQFTPAEDTQYSPGDCKVVQLELESLDRQTLLSFQSGSNSECNSPFSSVIAAINNSNNIFIIHLETGSYSEDDRVIYSYVNNNQKIDFYTAAGMLGLPYEIRLDADGLAVSDEYDDQRTTRLLFYSPVNGLTIHNLADSTGESDLVDSAGSKYLLQGSTGIHIYTVSNPNEEGVLKSFSSKKLKSTFPKSHQIAKSVVNIWGAELINSSGDIIGRAVTKDRRIRGARLSLSGSQLILAKSGKLGQFGAKNWQMNDLAKYTDDGGIFGYVQSINANTRSLALIKPVGK